MKHEETARRLKFAMAQANLEAQELADKSKVSKYSISQYVNGRHTPSNISAGKMAPILHVDPVWLMGFEVPMRKTDSEADSQYYLDEETAAVAQDLLTNSDLHALMSAARNLKADDLKMVTAFARRMKETNPDG